MGVERKLKLKEECPQGLQKLLWIENESESEENEKEDEPFSLEDLLTESNADKQNFILLHDIDSVKSLFLDGLHCTEEQSHDLVRCFQVCENSETRPDTRPYQSRTLDRGGLMEVRLLFWLEFRNA